MRQSTHIPDASAIGGGTTPRELAATARPLSHVAAALLLDVRAVAAIVGCSSRNVYRLSDGGRTPRPVKIGRLVRWRRADIETWIAAGCHSCR
ncbi:MAG: helix-turn-helix domain-containing protein [Planctomycetes bacterium]|nr:helix-turn-helix domain-containing protein [Planctomycetota bacterium]